MSWRTYLLAIAFGARALQGETALFPERALFPNSVKPVGAGSASGSPRIVRTALTAPELDAPIDVVIGLHVRSLAELSARVGRGESISRSELESKYLPLQADFDRLTSWLQSQGFSVTTRDRLHTNVIVRGSVSGASTAFGVKFARVATPNGEFTSAVTAPSLPREFTDTVIGIEGLQPHIVMHAPSQLSANVAEVDEAVAPAGLLTAYDEPTGVDAKQQPITGSGQTIALIMDSVPLMSDLTLFWTQTGSTFPPGNYSTVNVGTGPTSSSQTTDSSEATMDVEWASGMAPGSTIRLYCVPSLTVGNLVAAWTQIEDDGDAYIVSYSAGGAEPDFAQSSLELSSQQAALMAAVRITLLSSSGDGGSNPNSISVGNGYSASNPLAVMYPASDPSVTGVGGVTTSFDASWNATSETAWNQPGVSGGYREATGGGISQFFSRPAWQVASGVPAGTMRCVPDVAAMATSNPSAMGSTGGAFIIWKGTGHVAFGTSVSSPIWAGVIATINQFRESAGLQEIGFFNHDAYAGNASTSFYDTQTGNNGAYSAGAGYDLCTGLGSPDIYQLIVNTTEQVDVVRAPESPVSTGSEVTMSVTPQFTSSTFQWYVNGTAIPGAVNSAYEIPSASTANDGDYTVTITNSQLGALTYDLGTLSVTPPPSAPSATARLINISTRAQVGTGSNLLIPGFYISGTGTETLLIRADGPSLSQFSVPGVLAQPSMALYDSKQNLIASNTGWSTSANAAQIASVSKQVGAFALQAGSADCALIVSLAPGAYTVQVSGVGNTTGVALAEVYEVSSTGTRLSNISTRAQVGTGGNLLIPGFYISGSGTEDLLVRADGPALAQFSVTGVLSQPSLSVYDSKQKLIANNTVWGTSSNPTQISTVSSKVGAFALKAGSDDSADVVTLTPGGYTIQISGVGNTTGVALAEIYEDE